MKIKKMIVILFFLLSVIPLVFLGMVNLFYYQQRLGRIVENDLQVAVSTQMKAIENFYEEREADAEFLCGSTLVTHILENSSEATRASVGDLLRSCVIGNRFMESITLLDPEFQVVVSSEESVSGEKSVLSNIDSAYLSETLQFTGVVGTQRRTGPQNVVAAIQEIRDGDRFLGYLVMELNLEFFEEVRSSANLFNNGTIYLVDRDHQMIVAGDSVASRRSFVLTPEEREDYQHAWNSRDPESKQGILRYQAQGQQYISCYAKLDNIDWTMISSINFDEVIQAKQVFWALCALILVELALLLLAVNLIVSHNLGKPVYRMLEQFHKIHETGDYRIRMEETGGSEIGILSKEINMLLANIEDRIQKEKGRQRRLQEKAKREPLTGLFHKTAFEKLLAAELEQGHDVLCIYLDVDDFKSFNTKYGHSGGDQVLRFIAEQLDAYSDGLAGREGGDEFAACLRIEKDADCARRRLGELLSVINNGVALKQGGEQVPVYCSIGGAFSGEGLSWDELIQRADEAMYQVKLKQKNGFALWEEEPGPGKEKKGLEP